jgi:ribosomal protein S18 acetylase RimI-like enzyme
MNGRSEPPLIVETSPSSNDIGFLEEELYAFNVQTTGIKDGALLGIFLRGPDGRVVGGAYGWTWGGTCHVRYLFVPADMRGQGHGTSLMRAVEDEAIARGCEQIVLETHDFQAPAFYRRLGFGVVGTVEGYPRGHRYLVLQKRLSGGDPQG